MNSKMDISAKYRTKQPPREHEEAVRMLLENINAERRSRAQTRAASVQQDDIRRPMEQQVDEQFSADRLSFDSHQSDPASGARSLATSTSSSSDQRPAAKSRSRQQMETQVTGSSTGSEASGSLPARPSKVSSSNEDSTSASSGIDHDNHYREPIPSRTIAVQCDLKQSSLRQSAARQQQQVDPSMQVSSISSTRYGFYSFTPEGLEMRRRQQQIQRAVSSRELPTSGQPVEAPTSMSELSSADDLDQQSPERISPKQTRLEWRPTSGRLLDDNSQENLSRARIDSLPRRPMTALSYVSSSRLRRDSRLQPGQEDPASSGDEAYSRDAQDQEDRRRSLAKSRAMSHQALASGAQYHTSDRPKLLIKDEEKSWAESPANTKRQPVRMASQTKPPRPTLVSSSHNEHSRNYRTMDRRGPLIESSVMNQKQEPDYWNEGPLDRGQQMTMPRQPRMAPANENQAPRYSTMGRLPSSRLDAKVSRAYSQTMLTPKPVDLHRSTNRIDQYAEPMDRDTGSRSKGQFADVTRSTSTRQINAMHEATEVSPSVRYMDPRELYQTPESRIQMGSPEVQRSRYLNGTVTSRGGQFESDDSESPMTRTWANPAQRAAKLSVRQDQQVAASRKSSRSQSMRHPEQQPLTRHQQNLDEPQDRYVYPMDDHHLAASRRPVADRYNNSQAAYNSSSETSSLLVDHNAFNSQARLQPTFVHDQDYHEQQAVAGSYQLDDGNESNLTRATEPVSGRLRSSDFYSRQLPGASATITRSSGLMTPQYQEPRLGRRPAMIGGRAMSQQSLTRPTMSLARSRRRAHGTSGSQSGSDVGGSSMSLVSRLQGRYENAHTRSPVVMYIPEAQSRAESIGRPSTGGQLRRSSRSRQQKLVGGSQEKLGATRRSLSRNGSDSESSSMLRTLVKPRSSRYQASRRASRLQQHQSMARNDENEDFDNLGQLASEVDSYKFRRRYSVPKDAKINWFSKLKQRVTSVAK